MPWRNARWCQRYVALRRCEQSQRRRGGDQLRRWGRPRRAPLGRRAVTQPPPRPPPPPLPPPPSRSRWLTARLVPAHRCRCAWAAKGAGVFCVADAVSSSEKEGLHKGRGRSGVQAL
eukprot:351612-Chlamydomonas_euryale.AAC.18